MQTIRVRDDARTAAPCERGRKASRSGKASETPAPRRNRRRSMAEMGQGGLMSHRRGKGSTLFDLKRLALDDLMHERTESAGPRPDPRQDRLHAFAIGKLDASSGRIREQVSREVSGDLILALHEQSLEFVDIVELPPTGQLARCVDPRTESKFPDPPPAEPTRRRVPFLRAITVLPAADHVKVLESETGRINTGMARSAARRRAMLGELLSDRGRPARIGLERWNVRRRRIGRLAQEAPAAPTPPARRGR